MKGMLACLSTVVLLLGCGRGEKNGGGDSKAGSSEGNASQSSSKAGSGSANGEVTIDGVAQEKAGIRVIRIEPRAVPEYLTAAGQIVMNEERTAHVGTYTDGRVTEIHANIGDYVRRGTILARMHSHDVHETRAAYETALESVSRQQNAVAYAERMRDRMVRLYELKSASKQEVEKAEADLRSAQTDLANARIAVEKEVAHLTDILRIPASALTNINEEAEQVPVITPVSGTVVNRTITPGTVVEPGEEVFTVSDLSSVWMIASVNEADMSKVEVGNKAQILSQAYPDSEFRGQITRLGTELDPKTRTLQARILLPNIRTKLRPGMYVTAHILRGMSKRALFVPEDAVQDVNGSSIVFLRKSDNVFEPRAVQIAHNLNGQAEVSAGLNPGDAVVTKGSFVVKSQMLKSQIGE
ncbi:MAG: efflux RND transporter periplasmic adaptor subunit [Acidobacteriaceae bacterium]|nr:efflux RND transporter periplasmic adaptor subunit [Acidobacteriaceae bacterium]